MHNESLADRETETPAKPSKLIKVKHTLFVAAQFALPVVATGAATFFGAKLGATSAIMAAAKTAQTTTQM